MDQQFEHLSDAQVEHYGERGSLAGTDQEQTPDWDQKQDQKVEAHLDECPACRARVLTSARSHLALLTDAPVNTETSVNVDPSVHAAPRPDCPPEDDLRDLAAGLSPADQAVRLAQHAAQCDHCGPILRMYTEDFADDLTPDALSKEDQAILSKLKSGSSAWQKKLVRELVSSSSAAATSPSSVAFGRSVFSQPWLRRLLIPATAAACAAIAFFVWYSQRDTPEKVEMLLAQAYTEQRTMEMRVPGAAHADFKQTRSGESTSLLNSPESLRKAADVIASNLKKNPDDPKWLLLSARFDLQEGRYKPALEALDKITDDKIAGTPDYLMTRALALYEKAEAGPNSGQAYGESVDLLGKVLQKKPDDPVALFNQALACEKMYAYECALSDWGRLLKTEKDSGWAKEAREHQQRLEEKKTLGR